MCLNGVIFTILKFLCPLNWSVFENSLLINWFLPLRRITFFFSLPPLLSLLQSYLKSMNLSRERRNQVKESGRNRTTKIISNYLLSCHTSSISSMIAQWNTRPKTAELEAKSIKRRAEQSSADSRTSILIKLNEQALDFGDLSLQDVGWVLRWLVPAFDPKKRHCLRCKWPVGESSHHPKGLLVGHSLSGPDLISPQ